MTLVGTNFRNVKTGIVFKGNKGTANVVGVAGGATIGNTTSGRTGIKMEGDGRANATVMNMAFMGNRTATGAEVTSGTLTVNTVTMTNVQTGMKVTGSGRANVMGVGATINLASGGIGIKMEGGIANVVNMTFKGSGTGAEVTSGTLMLNTVKMTNVQTGAKVTNGMLTVNGGED
ncbi:hypothetical protein ME3_01094 [Bartonella melophagi K-2C]|uniref:Right handed beta helix domain-containing protein n=1 Tax=Bartonella melophagi K-2C TaxID=1094557 RepID=J0QRH2_9HYPH|nr:hypothetical protein ME3_01094 [Bartonella melophagi K-2C]